MEYDIGIRLDKIIENQESESLKSLMILRFLEKENPKRFKEITEEINKKVKEQE